MVWHCTPFSLRLAVAVDTIYNLSSKSAWLEYPPPYYHSVWASFEPQLHLSDIYGDEIIYF